MKPQIELRNGTHRQLTFWDGFFLGFIFGILSVGIVLVTVTWLF
jgi:hypothetical protein